MRTFTPKDYSENQTAESYSITQDTNGIMYFGNASGLLTFDHERWDFIPIRKGQYVISLCTDPSSNLIYAGCSGGEFGYVKLHANGEKEYVSLSDSLDAEIKLDKVWRTYTSKGMTFFQTELAVFQWNTETEKLTSILPKTSYHTMLHCEGDIYVRERQIGLKIWNGTEFTLIPDGHKFKDYGVFDILPYDSDQRLIVTQEMGMLILGGDSISALAQDSTEGLRNQYIIGGGYSPDSVYFLNSLVNGVFEMNRSGEITNLYSTKSGLNSNDIKSLFMDDHGNLWLATGNGISVLNTSIPLAFYSDAVGLEGNIQCVKEFSQSLLVGTSVGLFQQIGGRHSFEKLDLEQQVWDLEIVNDNLLIGTNNGLFIYDGFFLETITNDNVEDIYFDEINNTILASGAHGVAVYDVINNYTTMQTYQKSLGRSMGTAKDPGSGAIWIGTTQSGILKFEFDGFEYVVTEFGDEDGVNVGEWIKPVLINNKLKFGSTYGLLEFNEGGSINPSSKGTFTDYYDHPFPEFAEFNGFAQHEYTLWYCINHQIGSLENDTLLNDYPFQGLDVGRINFIQADSALWVGGTEALVRLDFDNPRKNKAPKLLVRSIHFKDSLVYAGVGPVHIQNIPYNLNDLKFSLAIVSSSIVDNMSYKYLNDDLEWSDWNSSPVIELHNLAYGEHTIEVVGKDQFGTETQKVSFSFAIRAPWYFKWWAFTIYLIFFLILIVFAVYMGRRRLRKQNIWLEGIVAKRTSELEKSYYQIKEQKEEITDSINYAKRIQEAILPRQEDINEALKDYFVLYRPKDIVSGDFYWFAEVEEQQIFVCADCTGHGVPGGFMSMIGSDKLNRKVLEEGFDSPSDILRELNIGIKQSLKQVDDEHSTRDGMDAAIVKIDGLKLSYSGANRPLWIVRNGSLNEIKPTKAAIAGLTPNEQEYELHQLQLEPGDAIYLTTDGYPDQFGGEKGKKFKPKQLKSILEEIHEFEMPRQKEILSQKLIEWMGNLEQIDDVCMVGIRI